MKKALFGGGCFWGVEHLFRKLPGVINTSVGYSGGDFKNPTYEDVCTGQTGHAEVVLVEYDAEVLNYRELVRYFFRLHNPTTFNRQGPDVGSQYRSVIFYYDEEDRKAALEEKTALDASNVFIDPVVTEIQPAKKFYRAEDYHQDWFGKHPGQVCHVLREGSDIYLAK